MKKKINIHCSSLFAILHIMLSFLYGISLYQNAWVMCMLLLPMMTISFIGMMIYYEEEA